MKNKYRHHCKIGTYNHQIPMPIKNRIAYIDYCISDIVAALNAANITTEASCCGHGEYVGSILLSDGRTVEIYPDNKTWLKHRKRNPATLDGKNK